MTAAGGGAAVWETLPNCNGVARVDAATGSVRYVPLDPGRPFGIAAGGGSAWVATDRGVVRLAAPDQVTWTNSRARCSPAAG